MQQNDGLPLDPPEDSESEATRESDLFAVREALVRAMEPLHRLGRLDDLASVGSIVADISKETPESIATALLDDIYPSDVDKHVSRATDAATFIPILKGNDWVGVRYARLCMQVVLGVLVGDLKGPVPIKALVHLHTWLRQGTLATGDVDDADRQRSIVHQVEQSQQILRREDESIRSHELRYRARRLAEDLNQQFGPDVEANEWSIPKFAVALTHGPAAQALERRTAVAGAATIICATGAFEWSTPGDEEADEAVRTKLRSVMRRGAVHKSLTSK
jgi:hypothetical protein